MRTKILELLRNRLGEYVSGESISQNLAVSRTAVWKHIQVLRQDGYVIESHPKLGYCLKTIPDLLLPDELIANLQTRTIGKNIQYFTQVDSTNNMAKKIALEGCPHGTIVIAEEQTLGKGRISRGWYSPRRQGIWFSLVLRPPVNPQHAPKFTLLAAVAICRAIHNATGIKCGIKWPNDILYAGKKVVGILTEMSAEFDLINYVVIGMGIDVNISTEEFPPELKDIATSLKIIAAKKIDRIKLLTEIINQLELFYDMSLKQGFTKILDLWRQMSCTLGQEVDVIGVEEKFKGKAIDIDDEGALLVQTGAGLQRVIAGDVSIRTSSID